MNENILKGINVNKEYRGFRDIRGAQVQVTDGRGQWHFLKNVGIHSPTGFEWGYGGSGPCDLAYSILFDVSNGNRELAGRYEQTFKWEIVAKFEKPFFELAGATIYKWLQDQEGLHNNSRKEQFYGDEQGGQESNPGRSGEGPGSNDS